MRLMLVSDFECWGGAAVAASRLAQGLVAAGADVTRYVVREDRHLKPWKTVVYRPSALGLAGRAMLKLGLIDYATLSRRELPERLESLVRETGADVINLHNIHMAGWAGWSWEMVRMCAALRPTVWTLHDMWSFTGRCAYAYDCRRFTTGCNDECPTWRESPSLEPKLIRAAWESRQHALAESPNVVAVCPSQWLASEAKAGLWRDHRVEVIPYGLPLDVYKPVRRELAREALGIEAKGPVLLIAAQDWSDRRKGGNYLVEALGRLNSMELTLLVLGGGSLPDLPNSIHVQSMGHIDHERTKVLVYNAADVFVHPAPVDNLPNVVLEAIACGTPVVGFRIGGVPDMVRPGTTGWLAEELSAASLAETIEQAVAELRDEEWRIRCRGVAEREYGLDLQTKRYEDLFLSIAGN